MEGPGIWVTCVKGKEKQTVGELYDVFSTVSSELWPEQAVHEDGEDDVEDGADDLEKQIAREVESMKRPRKEQRFGMSLPRTIDLASKISYS